jgi:hypothetical protein
MLRPKLSDLLLFFSLVFSALSWTPGAIPESHATTVAALTQMAAPPIPMFVPPTATPARSTGTP